ncbi:MAG: hypothetical protein AB7O52_16900 [Planctomycetota bacterium]
MWVRLACFIATSWIAIVDAQSVNNSCFSAIPLSDGGTQSFDTTFDSNDGPIPSCGGTLEPVDIWYTYTASCTGLATATMCGSSYDTRLVVYADTVCPPALEVGCDDDTCGLQSVVMWPVVAGATYLLQVCGYNGAVGAGQITVNCGPPALNDSCTNPLAAVQGLNPLDTTTATTDGLGIIPATCAPWFGLDPIIHNDLWWTYTVTHGGEIEITTCNIGNFDTRIAVWDNSVPCPPDPGLFPPIACQDDEPGCNNFTSTVRFLASAGQTVLIQIGGFGPSSVGIGQFEIRELGTSIPIFHYAGGPCPPELQVVNGNPANVECGVPRSRLFDPSSPLTGSLASGGLGFGTFPGPDDPNETGILVRMNDFAVDPLDPRAGIVIICLNIQLPPTPPTFRFVKTKIRRAAAFEISPAAQAVINSGRKNYWAAQARKIAMAQASIDPADQMAADRMRRMFKGKNNTDYDTLLDGTRYMPEACEETTTIEIIPGAPGATLTIYVVFQVVNFSTIAEFLSEIEVELSDTSNDPAGSPFLGSVVDNALVLENVDDLGPVAVVDFAGPPGAGQFSVPNIDLHAPENLNPQHGLWITNSSNETLELSVPGHPLALLPPDSQMAFNDLALGGVITALGNQGSLASLNLDGTGALSPAENVNCDASIANLLTVTWSPPSIGPLPTHYRVFQNGAEVPGSPFGPLSFSYTQTVTGLVGLVEFCVRAEEQGLGLIAPPACCSVTLGGPTMIIAGDPDGTGNITVGDAIISLSNLFPPGAGGSGPFGATPFAPGAGSCTAALDCNSDNLFNIADPIYLLAWLFAGGPPPPAWGGALPACHPASVLLGCLFPPSSCP